MIYLFDSSVKVPKIQNAIFLVLLAMKLIRVIQLQSDERFTPCKFFHKFHMQDFVVYFVDCLGIIQVEVTSTIIRILVLPYGNLDENKYCHLRY